MLGSSRTGRRDRATMPTRAIARLAMVAATGRRMQNSGRFMEREVWRIGVWKEFRGEVCGQGKGGDCLSVRRDRLRGVR